MKKTILFLGCCLLGWGSTSLLAQQGFVSTGGQATGAGGTVSFSIGQVDYLSAAGNNGTIIQGLQQPQSLRGISGYLTYDNAEGTVMNNCTVLLKNGNTVVDQTTTDAAGFFQFNNPETGSYTLSATTVKPWATGAVNATDALLILTHFVGTAPLTGIRLVAAGVV
ncbi:MAG: carboxypeptidase-like regulatory domain-containing protein [Bacteroidetes bacterium]|nr:carboxypeptidase-like regulatory domain-containing protein [Bacteroidota bacterium]